MQRFFENIALLDAFTNSLDYHQDCLECEHCLKNGQLVSHGFIYKQRSQLVSEPIGKRLFCSNRYGRTGCGRTVQLTVASECPSLHYGAAALLIFISSLLAHLCVNEAYQKATGQFDARNAWRWLNKLIYRLSDYRHFLKTRTKSASNPFATSVRRFQILLPTLARIVACARDCACAHYQFVCQKSFI